MISTTLSVKVDVKTAATVQEHAKYEGRTVSDLLREYVEAVATHRRWQLVDAADDLIGYASC